MSTVDGHYWVEINIDQSTKMDEFQMESPEQQAQIRKNIDYIISLANVSSRGRAMLERDLDKMEESDEEEEEAEEEGGQKS